MDEMTESTGTAGEQRRAALITGAGSGIGRAFAATLAAAGSDLLLLDVDAQGLATTVAEVSAPGIQVRSATADVANRDELERRLAELLAGAHGLDLVITCAAILGPGTWSAQSPQDFERVMQIDFVGTANTVRAALPWLRQRQGQIVVLASTAAVHGWPGLAAYSAAKFALVGYCDAIRPELATEGLGLTIAFPLLIDTPLLSRPGIPPILRQGRRIQPERVVRKVLRAAARRKRRVYIPGSVRVITLLHGLAPSLLDWYGTRFGLERP